MVKVGAMIFFSGCILVHEDAQGQSSFWAHLEQIQKVKLGFQGTQGMLERGAGDPSASTEHTAPSCTPPECPPLKPSSDAVEQLRRAKDSQ